MIVRDVANGLADELRTSTVLALFGDTGVGRSRLAASLADRVVTVETWRDDLLERLRHREPALDARPDDP